MLLSFWRNEKETKDKSVLVKEKSERSLEIVWIFIVFLGVLDVPQTNDPEELSG
jgi:hypothetical protein